MSALNHACFLLADRSLLRDMGSGFRDRREHFEPADLWPWIAVVVVIAGGLMLLSRWLTRGDSQHFFHSPRALWRALCHAHGLNRADQRLLALIARARGIEAPAGIFLAPEAFELGDDAPEELARHAEAIAALSGRLFSAGSQSSQPDESGGQTPDATAAPDAGEIDAVNAMIHEGSPAARDDVSTPPGEAAGWSDPAAATSAETRRLAAMPSGGAAQPKTTWAPAPSLFEPVPATVASSKGTPHKAPLSRGEGSPDGLPDDRATTFTEHQAVKALETLMRQINASRAATVPTTATGPTAVDAKQHFAIGGPALLGAITDGANLQPAIQSPIAESPVAR